MSYTGLTNWHKLVSCWYIARSKKRERDGLNEEPNTHEPIRKLISEKVSMLMLASGMSEVEAIEGAKRGDQECFEFLYGLHKRRVYSLFLRMTRNISEAEDFTQDAFLQLYRKIATFRGDAAFSTWLHRLTVNIILMRVRERGLSEVSLEETLGPVEEDGPKRNFGREDQVLAGSIDRLILERAIAGLSPGYRLIFSLHDIEGYSHNEIAEMLGRSRGNSASQLHKARMRLRDALKVTRAENRRHMNVMYQKEVISPVMSEKPDAECRLSPRQGYAQVPNNQGQQIIAVRQ